MLLPYVEAKPLIAEGDVLLFRGAGWTSRWIKWAGKGRYSHITPPQDAPGFNLGRNAASNDRLSEAACESGGVLSNMQIITYNCPIECDDAARKNLLSALRAERAAWNICSKVLFGLKHRSIKTLHPLTYHQIRGKYPHIPAQIIVKAQRAALGAYSSIKSNRHVLTTPAKKKRLAMRLDTRIYRIDGDVITITTPRGRTKATLKMFPRLREILANAKLCDPQLFERYGRLYLAMPLRVETLEPNNKRAIGIDLGIRRIAATSEGVLLIDKEHNAQVRKLRYLKRCLNRAETHSAKRHLKKLRRREANKSRELCHAVANRVLETKAGHIVLEDLSGLKKKKSHKKLKRVAQTPFRMLRDILTYKALLRGKRVITVSPSYTSRIDHKTGRLKGERRGCRFYTTRHGLVFDADVNAACNIGKRSNHPVSCSRVLDGQAVVIRPFAPTLIG